MAFGDPLPMGAAQPLAQVPDRPLPPMAAAVKKPGMNWLGILADALSGAAGTTPYHMQGLLMQKQMDREEQTYQSHQQSELHRQMQLYDYQRLHPNDETTQLIIQAGIDPNSVQGKAMYAQALQNRVNPFVAMDTQQPDGSTVKQYVRPPMAPTAPVGALSDTPPQVQGGPTPPASGGFPRPRRKQNGRLP